MIHFFLMEGKIVFQMAVETMAHSISTILEKNRLNTADLDFVVGHQANARIFTTLGEYLGLSTEKIIISIDNFVILQRHQYLSLLPMRRIVGGLSLEAESLSPHLVEGLLGDSHLSFGRY